jgi:polyhydroxyalkanoate synthase
MNSMVQQSSPRADNEEAFNKLKLGLDILLGEVKIETGRTPKEVIWRKNKAKLYRYKPTSKTQFPVPILIVYALINKPYVLDLLPGASLIEYLLGQGFDVYLLDWGTPGEEDKQLTFEHYILDYMPRVVRKMLRAAQAQEFTLLGYCMGGTMSAMYAALFPGQPLKNLMLLTTPIDFSPEYTGLYGMWTSEQVFNPDLLVEAFGNIPGELIDGGNKLIKPVAELVGTYSTMWERILNDKPLERWLAMNQWVNDGVPFPGAAFRQWIRELYQQNKLVKGEFTLRGRTVNLASIRCPILSIAGKRDQICSAAQAEAIMRAASSKEKEFFVLNAGHVGLLIGSDARNGLWPKLSGWLEPRSQGG